MNNIPNVRWMIHTKTGETFTDETHLPSQVPLSEITSVERPVRLGKSIDAIILGIRKHADLYDFFVKTSESRDFVMMGKTPGARPPVVEERIVGVHIGEPPNVYRLELYCDPRNCSVYLRVLKVPKATPDGF